MNRTDKELLLSDIDAGLILLDAKRPSQGTVNRASTIFQKVKVACQNIPITPLDESDPDDPPIIIDPDEPDPDPGTDPGGPDPTPVITVFTSVGDFSTQQGFRGWSYLEEDGTTMTYDATASAWRGRQAFQQIRQAVHVPGATAGAMRRWTAQGTGTFAITGSVADESSGGATGVRFSVLKNGVSLLTQDMADGGTIPSVSLTGNVNQGDTIDFLVKEMSGDIGTDGTIVNMSITLTTQGSGGTPTQTTLPFLLNGVSPQEAIYSINMNKPANADSCTLSVTGVNLDAAYGLLYFNGTSNNLAIWPTNGSNTGVSATVQLSVPVVYVFNGQNTLRFTHTTGSGFTVTAVSVQFTTPVTPEPPVTQTSLPFILNGSILPEDGLLTMTLSKPANAASTCTVSVTGTDLAEADGTMSVNGTTNSMTIWPVNASNNGAIRTVQLTVNSSWFNNGTNTIRFTHTSGDGFIISAVSVQFTQVPDPQPGTGDWPNQPSNLTTFADFGFNTMQGGGVTFIGGDAFITSDGTAPFSAPSFVRYRYVTGFQAGSSAAKHVVFGIGGKRECYAGFWWRPSNPWQGHTSNTNKIMFFLGNGATNIFLNMFGSSTPYRLGVCLENIGTGNSHLGNGFGDSGFGSWNLFGNNTTGTVSLGNWHRVEAYCKYSTTPSAQNGIIRWWLDGVLVGNFTNMNSAESVIQEWQFAPVWGGIGGVKTQTDFYDFDHVRVAV